MDIRNSLVIFTDDALFSAGIVVTVLSPKHFAHKFQTYSRNGIIINNKINITPAIYDHFNIYPHMGIFFSFPITPKSFFLINFNIGVDIYVSRDVGMLKKRDFRQLYEVLLLI